MSERGERSRSFRVRASGELACFTRPEFKTERVSYECMTPSAARGLLDAILWKPAIRWQIETITVLSPIRWVEFLRNEVTDRASLAVPGFYANERRTQRNTVALRDVDYVITASFGMTPRAGERDTVQKFEEMFERRLSKGQHFHQPCLGCREFAARVELAPPLVRPIDSGVDRPLGMLFYDYDYDVTPPQPLFFEARLTNGVMQVPPRAEVLALNREGRP